MADRRVFSSVNVRLRAHARRSDDPMAPVLFRWCNGPSDAPPETELIEAQVPLPLIRYLAALDRKLDLLIGLHGSSSVRDEFPLRLEVLEISGSGVTFRADERFAGGEVLEVVLTLSDAPPRLVPATGRVVGSAPDGSSRLEFTMIREDDRETVVQFVFQEEREQIRRSKQI